MNQWCERAGGLDRSSAREWLLRKQNLYLIASIFSFAITGSASAQAPAETPPDQPEQTAPDAPTGEQAWPEEQDVAPVAIDDEAPPETTAPETTPPEEPEPVAEPEPVSESEAEVAREA